MPEIRPGDQGWRIRKWKVGMDGMDGGGGEHQWWSILVVNRVAWIPGGKTNRKSKQIKLRAPKSNSLHLMQKHSSAPIHYEIKITMICTIFFFLRIDLACVKKLNRQSRCFTAVQINMTVSERRFAENYDFLQRLYICRILLRQYDNYLFVIHRKLQQCRQRKDRCADSMRVTFPLINLKRNCFWRSTLLS